ncbi:MAG: DUF805 domain-containing protein [Asticcacaulis sp.]|nr:DUF805 domain-containing protein [Asticcacaulis sp.]
MTFVQAIQSGFKNYAKFDGRASRSEYWWFMLFQFLVLIIPDVLMQGELRNGGPGLFTAVYVIGVIALFLPSLGLGFRRLHDTDRSAWWLFIALVPLVGVIVLLVFYCQKGTPGPNKYGDNPLGGVASIAKTFE